MRTALMVLALLAAPAVANQSVWKWVDEKGVTHYSDRPVQGAERVEISVGARTGTVPATPSSRAPSNQPAPEAAYSELEIWKPGNGDSIVNSGGVVEVRVRIQPDLQPQHTLSLYMDGRPVEGFPRGSLEHTLREVPRGVHSLTAVVVDGSGKRLRESPAVRFSVRQESIAQPPVGPALRSPPRPRAQAPNKLPATQPSHAALHGQHPKIDPRTNAPLKN